MWSSHELATLREHWSIGQPRGGRVARRSQARRPGPVPVDLAGAPAGRRGPRRPPAGLAARRDLVVVPPTPGPWGQAAAGDAVRAGLPGSLRPSGTGTPTISPRRDGTPGDRGPRAPRRSTAPG